MNIWLIQTGESLPIRSGVRKMRTAILADKLLERGHNIFWWASAFEHQQKEMVSKKDKNFDISKEYIIRVLKGCRYYKNITLTRYLNYKIMALKFRFQANKFPKPDIIVAAMPDHLLAYEAAQFAYRNSIPFLVDIRDLWPETFLGGIKNPIFYKLVRMFLTFDFARLFFLLKNADALIAISKGILQWGLDKIGRSQSLLDKVFYLGYKASSDKVVNLSKKKEAFAWLKKIEKKKIFIFIGTFGVSYELDLILEAAKRFDRLGKIDICFVLAGTGEKFGLISEKALGLDNVILPGWIGKNEINALLKMGYVGMVPCRSVKNAIPNKPFEYLSAGLPIISSLEGEMANLIEQYNFGLNYSPGDLNGLFNCIERLAFDHNLCNNMSISSMNFFNKYGNADKIYEKYVNHIEYIVKRRSN